MTTHGRHTPPTPARHKRHAGLSVPHAKLHPVATPRQANSDHQFACSSHCITYPTIDPFAPSGMKYRPVVPGCPGPAGTQVLY